MRNFLVQGRGNTDLGIMLIGEYPSRYDYKNNTFFEHYPNFKKIVNESLEFDRESYSLDDIYCTYAVKKYIPSDTGVTYPDFLASTSDDDNDFLDILAGEIDKIKPKVIICLGSNVTKLLTKGTLIKTADQLNTIINFTGTLEHKPSVITCYSGSYIENQLVKYGNIKPLEAFSRAIDKCFYVVTGNTEALQINYTQSILVESKNMFDTLLDYVEQTGIGCFDYETTGLKWYDETMFCTVLSISFQIGSSYIIPLYHREPVFDYDDAGNILEKGGKYVVLDTEDPILSEELVKYFISELERRLFNNPNVIKIAHNLKFDMHWNKVNGIHKYSGRFNDTMLMSHILNELTPNGLKDLTREYFPQYANYEKALKKYHYATTPLTILSQYAGIDTDITLRLWVMFEEMLINDDPDHLLYILYRNLTMPAFRSLFEAEHHGAKIDRTLLNDSIIEAEDILKRKLTKLKNFREVKKFEKYESKKKNRKELENLNTSIANRKAMLTGKIDDKLVQLNSQHAEYIKERAAMVVTEEDKLSKRSNYSKLNTKINRTLKNITSYEERKLVISEDKIIKGYQAKKQEIKLGTLKVYTGINFNSPDQLADLLFTPAGLGLPMKEEFRGGDYVQVKTTGADYLKEFDEHPFINCLFEYRSVAKMVSTYYKGILKLLDKDGYLHTSFKLNGTVSGRLSSVAPNLQNIPARSKVDDPDAVKCLKRVKQFFVPKSDNYYIMQFDYSQAELRLIANFSRDETMMSTYLQGIDLHTMTASKLSGTDYDSFLELDPAYRKKQRSNAKGANFGLVYDISIDGYLEYCKNTFNLILTYDEAKEHYDKFFAAYPSLKKWHKEYTNMGKRDGFVRTLFGRKRRLPHINEDYSYQQSSDVRFAINSPIQGTGGEYTLFSIAILRHRLPKEVIFFNTVHDSIFFYIPKHLLDYVDLEEFEEEKYLLKSTD